MPSQQIKPFHKCSTLKIVSLFLLADLAFIVLHLFFVLTVFAYNPLFSIVNDSGYAELFQYLKWFWIVVLFVYISIFRRSFSYLIWAIVFLYILCDDAFQIHEIAGNFIAMKLTITPPFGLRLQDLGEMAVSAIAGAVLFILVLLAYLKGSEIFRKISRDIIALIFVLGFFGIAVDIVHTPFTGVWILNLLFVLMEDGGEMFIASLIFGYVFFRSSQSDEDETIYLGHLGRRLINRFKNSRKDKSHPL